MRRVQTLALCLLIGIGASGCGGGGDDAPPPNPMYVRVSGSDTNDGGSPASALRTIGRAAQRARDAYTIIVGPGIYTEGVTTVSMGATPQAVVFVADVDGSETGDAPGAVVVDANGARTGAGFTLANSRGSTIDGFTVIGGADAGIVIKSTSHDFVIRNCEVRDNPGDGIRIQDSARVLIFNNLVARNGAVGVGIVGPGGSGSPQARLISNSIVANGNRGITIGNSTVASPGATLRNNIIQDNRGDANIKVFAPPPSSVPPSDVGYGENFDLISPPSFIPTTLPRGVNSLFVDAQFVDAPGGDFHLTTTSPALDSGTMLVAALEGVLLQRTTTGGALDALPLDLGYHFLP